MRSWMRSFARAERRSASWLGAERDRVECGVSIGIASSTEALLEQVDGYLEQGYRRIKLKIEPGTDVERVRAVRDAHPEHPAVRRRERRVHRRPTPTSSVRWRTRSS